tara:strand:+ start:216 stop:473 length:258 start_codon:yes stop_codon:yes gene_type:complete
MVKAIFVLCALAAAVALASADATDQYRITSLPGLAQMPSFGMYSGYITLDNGQKLFFWFVESQNDPATDPLVVCTHAPQLNIGML